MTSPNSLREQIIYGLADYYYELSNYESYTTKEFEKVEARLQEVYADRILALINEHANRAVVEHLQRFVGELDDIDPGQPLEGTPQDYVHRTLFKYTAALTNEMDQAA